MVSYNSVLRVYHSLITQMIVILDSSMVEHAAVNRGVVGSSPTRGAFLNFEDCYYFEIKPD